MPDFRGFNSPSSDILVPNQFFQELLPAIDQLHELQLTLYILWWAQQAEGPFRYLRREDLAKSSALMNILGKTHQEAQIRLDDALERAVHRGTLLQALVRIQGKNANQFIYFLNSPRGHAALAGLEAGTWHLPDHPPESIEITQERPNIFQHYEENIGPLTPMLAEILGEAEDTYSADWVVDAIEIAVKNNVRRWRYVEAILERWQQEGRHEQKDRPDSPEARERYFEELAKRLQE